MKNAVLVITLVLIGSSFFAQEAHFEFDPSQNTVIATNGLNLRSTPSLKAKILSIIPYGAKVEVLETQHYGSEILESPYEVYFNSEESYTPKIAGYWIKARYGEAEGFLFSSYLNWEMDKEGQWNKEVTLLFEGLHCTDNFNYDPSWNWYGCYKENGTLVLKKVNLSFFLTREEMAGFGISTNIKAPSYFLIGSKKPLLKTVLNGTSYSHIDGENGYFYDHQKDNGLNEELLKDLPFEFFKNPSNDWDNLLLLRDKEGNEQILNKHNLQLSRPLSILWKGDLDGDDKEDYIIQYGEESSQTVLYLSTHAGSGEVTKAVAAWISGYCC